MVEVCCNNDVDITLIVKYMIMIKEYIIVLSWLLIENTQYCIKL